MGRPRKCPICTADSAIKLQIDALLIASVSIKTVVSQVAGYSRDQLSRHKHRCLQPQPVPECEPESTTAQAEKWLARADSTYALASINGDSKAMVSAISAATRALTALDKRKAVAAAVEKEAANSPDRSLTISECDRLLREFRSRRKEDYCYYCGRSIPEKEQEKTNTDALTN